MRVPLPSKLRKTKRPKQNLKERESCTRAHTLSHNHTRAYSHYCSSMVGYSEAMGGSASEKEKQQQKNNYIFNSIFRTTYGLNRHQSNDSEVWCFIHSTWSFIHSTWFPAAEFINQAWCHVFSVIHTVCKEKPQSFYANVVDGVVSLVEVISSRFASPVFNVRKVFFEAGVKGASNFTDVDLSAFGAMNDV